MAWVVKEPKVPKVPNETNMPIMPNETNWFAFIMLIVRCQANG
jgi:hypothetical protein